MNYNDLFRKPLKEELDFLKNQKEMAGWYCENLLCNNGHGQTIEVNEYIIKRWSISGLINVKRLAWKEFKRLNNN